MRASNSVGFTSESGERIKNSVEAAKEMITITRRFLAADLRRSRSLVPRDKPMPMMGPMRGETSMAPMMTAVELTLSPTEASTMAKARIQTLGPRNQMPDLMRWAALSVSTSSKI